jgi:hypothetical protein
MSAQVMRLFTGIACAVWFRRASVQNVERWVITEPAKARWLCQQIDVLAERTAADQRGDSALAEWLADVYDLATGRLGEDESLPLPRHLLYTWGFTSASAALLIGVSERAVTKAANRGTVRAYRSSDGSWIIDPRDVCDWGDRREAAGLEFRYTASTAAKGIRDLKRQTEGFHELFRFLHLNCGFARCRVPRDCPAPQCQEAR